VKKFFTPEAIVGLFAVAGIAIIVTLSLQVSDTNIARGKAMRYFATFESVTGIVNKSPIETAGIRVGYIDSLALLNGKARVSVKVISDLPLYQNATLSIKDMGILGDRYLKLDPGTPDYPPIPPDGEIKNCFSQSDLDKMMTSLGSAAEKVDKIMKSLTDEEGKGSLGGIMKNIKELATNLNEMVKANRQGIDTIISNLEKITTSLKATFGDGAEWKETGETLRDAIKKIDSAMESLQSITKKIDKGEGTIGKLVNDDTTVKKLNTAIEGVNEYLDSARKIQTSISYRGEYLKDSKKMQNMVAVKIQPKPDKYLRIGLMDAPVGRTRVTDTTVVTPPDNTVVAQTKTVESTDQFLFSLEVAKRFYDLNLRFGIIRNRGGAGFDYYFMKDLVEISFEAFDFARFDNRPHLRAYTTFTLYKYFQLTGGVDDMIDRTGNRNLFFGAGFTFTDNDLKTILTSFKIPGM
jgi:phospholipid/cholesterol/gamma-HCH transport system substrate-binding protein